MWLTAEKRFVRHVCLRNPCHMSKSKPLSAYQKLEFPRAAVRSPALHYVMVASCPSHCCSCRKNETVRKSLCYAEKQRVWSLIYGLQDLLQCSDWKWGCQPFSCPCSQNVTQCQTRFGRHVGLRLRHPFPPFLFGMYSYNLNLYPKLEVPESSTLHQLCTMVASCPSLRCSCRKR